MLYRIGRLMQLAGMLLIPVAIAGNLAPGPPLDLRQSLTLSGVGILIFWAGYLIQQQGRPGG